MSFKLQNRNHFKLRMGTNKLTSFINLFPVQCYCMASICTKKYVRNTKKITSTFLFNKCPHSTLEWALPRCIKAPTFKFKNYQQFLCPTTKIEIMKLHCLAITGQMDWPTNWLTYSVLLIRKSSLSFDCHVISSPSNYHSLSSHL